jgi:hypothetical protein
LRVHKGRAETGAQFFARRIAERGNRYVLDEALASARDALESAKLTSTARACIEADRAIVREAQRDGALSPEAHVACMRLVKFGVVVRFQSEAEHMRTRPATDARRGKPNKKTEALRGEIEALCKGRSLDARGLARQLLKKLKLPNTRLRAIQRHLASFRAAQRGLEK